jgi:hypothetical protein
MHLVVHDSFLVHVAACARLGAAIGAAGGLMNTLRDL